jgi:hypothetical protein
MRSSPPPARRTTLLPAALTRSKRSRSALMWASRGEDISPLDAFLA